jgi:NH3-dependent NAD+ synthetase
MKLDLFQEFTDFSDKNVSIGLSGGINSSAVLCQLADYPTALKPKNLFLFYIHFREHSPDTIKFVHDCVRFAKKNFKSVNYEIQKKSVLKFFEKINYLPHPRFSPCTVQLKIEPARTHTHTHTRLTLIWSALYEKKKIGC